MSWLLPFERVALVLLAVLLTVTLFWIPLYNATWFLGGLFQLLTRFVGLAMAVGGVVLAIGSDEPVSHRVRGALAVPAALLAEILLGSPTTWLGYRLQAEWQLWHRGAEYQATIMRGGGEPQAFEMLSGIPDGGVSLVYLSAEAWQTFGRRDLDTLVNGNIYSCRSIRVSWRICSFG